MMKDHPIHKCFFNPNTHEKNDDDMEREEKIVQRKQSKIHNLLN